MTRKDYERLARALAVSRQTNSANGHQIAISDAAIFIAAELAADNPRFDRVRFLKACGVES